MKADQVESPADIKKRLADYAMALDLMGSMTSVNTEPEVIEKIIELFSMLCSPSSIFYLPVVDGKCGEIVPLSSFTADSETLKKQMFDLKGNYVWTESGKGFILRICTKDEAMGIIRIEGLAFPEYKEHYLNLALNITGVLTIAILNARHFDKLKEALSNVKTLSGMLPICASCKHIRDDKGYWKTVETYITQHSEAVFTSGICPDCEKKMYEELEKLKNEDT